MSLALGVWRARGLVALHVDAPTFRVGHYQMGVRLAFELESRARLVQQIGFSFRAALRDKRVDKFVAPLILHEFDPRGAHKLEHVALAQSLKRDGRRPVEVADGLQLKLVARAHEAHARQERKGVEAS